MGYTTDFVGCFITDRQMSKAQTDYLNALAGSRRVTRDPAILASFPDPLRVAVGHLIGEGGEYYVASAEDKHLGQTHDESIVDFNRPPSDQPSLWLGWVVEADQQTIKWNGVEKFYCYTEWLQYIIENFLQNWGYELNGSVMFQGEDITDRGMITVTANVIVVTELG